MPDVSHHFQPANSDFRRDRLSRLWFLIFNFINEPGSGTGCPTILNTWPLAASFATVLKSIRVLRKPLVVLLISFAIALIVTKFAVNNFDIALSGRIAMAIMLIFTSIGHFAFTPGMEMMIPSFIPFKKAIVYLTGIIEICSAFGLLIANFKIQTAWLLILFFILLLPANIYAAIKHVDYQKGTFEGSGKNYLWFRVPLQVLFIAWTYFFAIGC